MARQYLSIVCGSKQHLITLLLGTPQTMISRSNIVDGSKPYIVEDRPMLCRSSGDRGAYIISRYIDEETEKVIFAKSLQRRYCIHRRRQQEKQKNDLSLSLLGGVCCTRRIFHVFLFLYCSNERTSLFSMLKCSTQISFSLFLCLNLRRTPIIIIIIIIIQ